MKQAQSVANDFGVLLRLAAIQRLNQLTQTELYAQPITENLFGTFGVGDQQTIDGGFVRRVRDVAISGKLIDQSRRLEHAAQRYNLFFEGMGHNKYSCGLLLVTKSAGNGRGDDVFNDAAAEADFTLVQHD